MKNHNTLNNIIEESENDSLNQAEFQQYNAYYLKNSHFLAKEERDPSLIKSIQRGGYLIPATRSDLLEKYQTRFICEPIYDPILNVPEKAQKRLALRSWKLEKQREKFKEISFLCQKKGLKIKDCLMNEDSALISLKKEYEELQESIAQLDREINYYTNEQKGWEDPIPLPSELPPVAKLNCEILPEPIRHWIEDIADRMQIPADFSAAASIVGLGSLIGRKVGIYPKRRDDWLVVPNLWGAIVGRPSLLKSPAIAEVLKPLNLLANQAIEQFKLDKTKYEKELLLKEAMKMALKDTVKKAVKEALKNGSHIELTDFVENYQQTPEPVLKRYKTEDGTVEKIGDILIQNPQGILIHRDELSGWLKSLDKYGREGDRAFYLESWNGSGEFTVDRIGRGTLHIPALCLSVLGGIQPGPLAAYIYQAAHGGYGDDGLLQRFQLLVWPDPPTKWKNVDRFPDNAAKQRAYQVFKRLDLIPIKNQHEVFAIRFSEEAQNHFDGWRNELENRLRAGNLSHTLESHLAKYRSLIPSLALIFHLIETVDQNNSIVPVASHSTLQAIEYCQYLESHAIRLYASRDMPEMQSAKALLEKLKKGCLPNTFSLREVYYGKHWTKLASPKEVENAIQILEEFGWVRKERQQTGGRPNIIIRVHPILQK